MSLIKILCSLLFMVLGGATFLYGCVALIKDRDSQWVRLVEECEKRKGAVTRLEYRVHACVKYKLDGEDRLFIIRQVGKRKYEVDR